MIRLPARWRAPLAAYFVTRVVLIVWVWWGLGDHAVRRPMRKYWRAFTDNLWIDGWARWDSGWYWDIAKTGWASSADSKNVNFFPLYSWICQGLSLPLRPFLSDDRAFYVAGLIFAHACFIAALVGLYRLTAALTDEKTATRATWLLALFPFSFFYGAVYTESMYLALVVWAFYFAHLRRWPEACVLIAFAGATRIVGFVAIGALGLEYLRQRGWRPRRDILWFLITPIGIIALLGWCWWAWGDWLMPYNVQIDHHGRRITFEHLANSVDAITRNKGYERMVAIWYLAFLPAVFALGVHAWRRFGAGHGAFVLVSLVIAVLSGMAGLGRYVSVLYPIFMSAAVLLKNRYAFWGVCLFFAPFLMWFADEFAHWNFIN